MAPNVKVQAAFRAMKDLGIPEQKTKPVLKRLLRLYEKNWKLIEEENYRALADAIFEDEETVDAEKKKMPESTDQGEVVEDAAQMMDEPERPLKRLRKKHQSQDGPSLGQPSPRPGEIALKIPKEEPSEPEAFSGRLAHSMTQPTTQRVLRNKGKQPVVPQSSGSPAERTVSRSSRPGRAKEKETLSPQITHRDKTSVPGQMSNAFPLKEPKVEPGIVPAPKQNNALIKPKDEPYTDDMPSVEVPLAVVRPEALCEGPTSKGTDIVESQNDKRPVASEGEEGAAKSLGMMDSSSKKDTNSVMANVSKNASAMIDIAASASGEVKILLSCESVLKRPDFCAPGIETVMNYMDDKYLKSDCVMGPTFSVAKLMTDFCDSFEELGSSPADDSQKQPEKGAQTCIPSKKSAPEASIGHVDSNATRSNAKCSDNVDSTNVQIPASSLNDPEKSVLPDDNVGNGCRVKESDSGVAASTKTLVVHQNELNHVLCLHNGDDITKGEEKVRVPLDKSNSNSLPSFHYIHKNVVFHNADVSISVAQIGDGDCCSTCSSDCLSSAKPCACINRNGGKLMYSPDGLVKEEFLEECIAMARNPQKHCVMYCKECPLERSKNEDMLESCKGHLKRNFIKECWIKCACSKFCGNRVVQRGMGCNLQVFWTSEGKGWGLRTLEDLPKGTFVCEYVGEILTSKELRKRNLRGGSDKNSYSVLLDSDWGSGVLKDEQALCLDATFYGNVARFINHRCFDANLIEIPVEVETPNHQYYHVALFTTRKIDALEELTWDYGIDFDDHDSHFKAFRCLCGSKFCRNMKRSNRSRSASTLR